MQATRPCCMRATHLHHAALTAHGIHTRPEEEHLPGLDKRFLRHIKFSLEFRDYLGRRNVGVAVMVAANHRARQLEAERQDEHDFSGAQIRMCHSNFPAEEKGGAKTISAGN